MTAEIAIMNRDAVTLATDSAVTLTVRGTEKIYNSADKLFELSDVDPMGIMIYNNLEYMGISLEVAIKQFRLKRIHKRSRKRSRKLSRLVLRPEADGRTTSASRQDFGFLCGPCIRRIWAGRDLPFVGGLQNGWSDSREDQKIRDRELESLAEELINITSVKRKFSSGTESVGGPIDVAIISRIDGFVWIGRKHYFQPNLNPRYFHRKFGTMHA
jgi:hypothetical protein